MSGRLTGRRGTDKLEAVNFALLSLLPLLTYANL